ncbi:MAG TPA: histidine kinase [Oscillatoriaceae cyanobacterium M33_DOE_052]|uniref:histidine kinase n=1 Tax=Planktothricoides sp. SpSt-374 TaxID=2282167 RepID=A0A7C3VN23_9CYAN|nr:histidine kinase [Oscillatoriaceae cyanobacterium M33_DOE_052]
MRKVIETRLQERYFRLFLAPISAGFGAQDNRLPQPLVWGVLAACLLPLLLNPMGFDFSSHHPPLDWETAVHLVAGAKPDPLYHSLAGDFTHTILEWSAFCTAIFTVILAFAHFSIDRNPTTPVIGVTLLCAGVMDAFHTLAADRLIDAVADNQNLIPFTWAICRLANALLAATGISILMASNTKKWQHNIHFVFIMTSGFVLMAYGIIHFCATSQILPETIFPDAIIARPWDVAPLLIFIMSGIFLYPKFYQENPSIFSHALVISTIPNTATQLYMVFGSDELFDNNFNVAHLLKIIAYLVPLMGLIFDYSFTHKALHKSHQSLKEEMKRRKKIMVELEKSEARAIEKNRDLEQALRQLQHTQSQLIQAEKMSSLGTMVAGIAHEINNPINFIYGNTEHANNYIQELLELLDTYREEAVNISPAIQAKEEEIELEFIRQDLSHILASIKNGTNRIRQIVLSLRNFSRLDEATIKSVNIHEGIDSTLVILNHKLKQEIKIHQEYGNLPLVECYPALLNQVWLNILTNAIDVLEIRKHGLEGGSHYQPEIYIHTEIVTGDGEPGRVRVRIGDNGPGMTADIKNQIFDPFFTTKPVGFGTGLGLSICFSIVQKHSGKIDCISQPGEGTEFVIDIPIRRPKMPPNPLEAKIA